MKTPCFSFIVCLVASLAPAEPLTNVKVVNDRAPDCSSLESIVATVTRGCKTDDEKAIALYNFCRYVDYHHAYPEEPGGISALKTINVYGWGLCGGLHTEMAALWEKAGYKWRYRGWSDPGHSTVEVFYGGRWHYLDTFLKFYAWMPDAQSPGGRTIAGQLDIRANPSLVRDVFVMDREREVCYQKGNRFELVGDKANWTAPAFMVCGDTFDDLFRGIASSSDAGSPRGWSAINFDDPTYSTSVDLAPGYSLDLAWDKIPGAFYFAGSNQPPHHSCGDKDYRNCPAIGPILEPYRAKDSARSWSNGTLRFSPDLRSQTALAGFHQVENVLCREGTLCPKDESRPGVLIVRMASPYVVVQASGKIASEDAKTEISTDLKKWTSAPLDDMTKVVQGKYAYDLRVTFRKPISAMELTSLVQHNQEALPYLAPGRNVITIAADKPVSLGDNRLAVTYAYAPGSRDVTPEQVLESGREIAKGQHATWSETPIVVQRIIDQLPCTFEILVPTPKGKQPVYPRMLFLRREVLGPGQKPADVPAPPSTPAVGPNETLATLPNPWMMGIERPPAQPERPTKTAVLPRTKTAYVSKKGQVFEHQFIKWFTPAKEKPAELEIATWSDR